MTAKIIQFPKKQENLEPVSGSFPVKYDFYNQYSVYLTDYNAWYHGEAIEKEKINE